jgi:hypothetical protein
MLPNDKIKGYFPIIPPHMIHHCLSKIQLNKLMVDITSLKGDINRDIHEMFNFKGTIFLDCGIFNRYRRQLTLDYLKDYRDKLIEKYTLLKPDIASALDIPALLWHDINTKKERTEWSLQNYLYMREKLKGITLVLGVCGFSKKSVTLVSERVKSITGSPEILGIGGLVPLIRRATYRPELGRIVVRTISLFRINFPDSFIHAFGAGGHRWYILTRFAGATSSDSSSVIQSTMKWHILIPGEGARHLSMDKAKTKTEIAKPNEVEKLKNCECPTCKNNDISILERDKNALLIHNLFVTLNEARIVDEICERNDRREILKHLKDRFLSHHSFLKPVAKELIKVVTTSKLY